MVEKEREYKDTIDKQHTQIEEMERRIKILEGDLEAVEDGNEENKKLVVQMQDTYVHTQPSITNFLALQESNRAGIHSNHSN